jgi:hypothetical protein
MDHKQETNKEIKVLQEMNTKCDLSPDLGVDKLKKERKQALKNHVDDLMTHFWAKSRRWTSYNNRELVVAPTESNMDLRPNVPVCVFVPDELDHVSLPDLSTIDRNMLTVTIDDAIDDTV